MQSLAMEGNVQLEALSARVQELAVLPHVVFKILELTSTDTSSAAEIERAITVDPGFSSKVLTVANSAVMGLPRKVTSIREASMFLGFRQIRSLAMTVGVFDMFVGKTDKESLRRRQWWRHSVDSAVCAKWLAFHSKKANADDVYTGALLHLIGKTLLDRVGGQDYERVEAAVAAGAGEFEAEQSVYGADHVALAMSAARKWGLPEDIVEGLDYVSPRTEATPGALLGAYTSLASTIVKLNALGHEGSQEGALSPWALELLGYKASDTDGLVDAGTAAIATAQLHI